MPAESTDAQLVRRVQRGDKGAFDLLVLKYQHKIVNLVLRYVRDPDQALDIAQEAFLKAYRALPRFRGDSAFYTWLYRIAVNTAKNYLAAQRRRPMDVELDLQDPEQYDLHAKLKETDTPEGVTLSRELNETVQRAIEALPEDLRTAIVLRELDGMSYEEIAQTMECPVGTVRSRIFRARDAIGKKIGNLID
ncbi:MAG: RNA polymerase sigma factor RpoE [Pseudomonadota bacterium]